MFRKVTSTFLRVSLQRAGVDKQVEAYQGVECARVVLKERFGEGVEVHAQPKYIRGRSLAIAVAHPAVAQEIRLSEESIIAAVNDRIGRPEVVRIHFLLPRDEESLNG